LKYSFVWNFFGLESAVCGLTLKGGYRMGASAEEQAAYQTHARGRRVNVRTAWKKRVTLLVLISIILVLGQGAWAQEYPTQSINLLIDRPPGAGTDVVARAMAPAASKILGQEVIPVNKPGAGGAVAVGITATSKSDGYTILAHTTSSLTVIPHLESVSYDPLKDVIPVVHFGTFYCGILVRADSPYKSVKDLVNYARKNPGKVSFGIVGIGNAPHLDIELVIQQEKLNMPVVPLGGGPPALTALLGGHVTAIGVGASAWMQSYKAGKVRVLATTTEKRVLPDVPTLHESGYPFYNLSTEYYLVSAPKGTPAVVVTKLEGAFRKAMEAPQFRTTAESFYVYDPNPLSRQALKELIETLYRKNGEIIQKTKLNKQG
jgi:tripartite-type tricarboxylate transporter receptor subunit TctC